MNVESTIEVLLSETEQLNPAIILADELMRRDAAELLSPLWQPWSPKPAVDPLARFLAAAKDDFWQATSNSRQYAEALSERRRDRGDLRALWRSPLPCVGD